MPVYPILCPDCGHGFGGMVFAGTRVPEVCVCPECGCGWARPLEDRPPLPHPLEAAHGAGCPCCGGESSAMGMGDD